MNSMHHSSRHIFYHPWILVFYFFDIFLAAALNLVVLLLATAAATTFWFVVVLLDIFLWPGHDWVLGVAIAGWLTSLAILAAGWVLWLFRLLLPGHFE